MNGKRGLNGMIFGSLRAILGIGASGLILSVSIAGDPLTATGMPRSESALVCGDPADSYRVAIKEQRLDTAFESFEDWRRAREAEQRAVESLASDSSDSSQRQQDLAIKTRFHREAALESIHFLVELTSAPCTACDANEGIDLEKLPEDLEQWHRGADRYRQSARQVLIDQQRACVLRFLNRRDDELSQVGRQLAAGQSGSENSSADFPSQLELAFGAESAATVSLTSLQPRAPWTTESLTTAQVFSARLRQFIERGTSAAWRALVGAPDRDAYRARLGSGAASLREKLSQRLVALDAYGSAAEAFFKTDGFKLPPPPRSGQESEAIEKLRELVHQTEERLATQAHEFLPPSGWNRFAIADSHGDVAVVRIQLPTTLFPVFFSNEPEGPYSPAAHRQHVADYRLALDDCIETIDSGFSIEPGR